MGLPLLVGSLLIAFGPSSIFYVTTVSRRPYLLVVSLFGFLWSMLSFVLSGAIFSIWNIWSTPPLPVSMVLSILFFELLRPFVYKFMNFACKKLNEVDIPLSITAPTELFKLSVCSGMGTGLLTVLSIALVPLTSAGYAADYYMPQCNCMSLYVVIAIESLCVMPLHVLWTYLTLRAYSSKYWPTAIVVCILHILQGCVTLLNQVSSGCIYAVVILVVLALGAILVLSKLVANSCHLMFPPKKAVKEGKEER